MFFGKNNNDFTNSALQPIYTTPFVHFADSLIASKEPMKFATSSCVGPALVKAKKKIPWTGEKYQK